MDEVQDKVKRPGAHVLLKFHLGAHESDSRSFRDRFQLGLRRTREEFSGRFTRD